MTPRLSFNAASLIVLCVAAPASRAIAARTAAPPVTISGVSDGVLRAQIEAAVNEGAPPAREGPYDAAIARRQGVQAAKDAIALLRSEGYYDGTAAPGVSGGAPIRALLKIMPGPRYRLSKAIIAWSGSPPDAAAQSEALKAMRLPVGAPGRAADIVASEGRAIDRLRRLGYADASLEPREVVVDHASHAMQATVRVTAGGRISLGAAILAGRSRTRPRWVARLAPWKTGATYNPALLAKMEKRLIETGAYEAATVALAPATSPPQTPRPVEVTLVDRKPYSLELGASYSTTEGSGVDGKWTRYNRLGLGDQLILSAKLYDIEQRLDLEQDLPSWGLPAGESAEQTLKIGGGFLGDRTPAYSDLGAGARVAVVRRWDKTTSATLGGAFDFVSTRERDAVNLLATPVGQRLNLYIVTGKAAFTLDRSNDELNPIRGWRLEAEADPTGITGNRQLAYFKVQGQATAYAPLGGGWPVLAARIRIGSILGGSIPDVPADRRFFAGGGGSVRGYGYQAIGPQLSDRTPIGGLSLTEGSFEVRQAISRNWGLVAFADLGGVGSSPMPDFTNLALGVGAGVRYDLGFGPLRVDIGTPVDPKPGVARVQVYISIGQAF